MTTRPENPYQSPEALPAGSASPDEPAEVSWKAIAKRWEVLRIPYNLVVGFAGLLALVMVPDLTKKEMVAGAVAYGLCANVLYLLGPVTEMYLNWFVDTWEDRLVPRWAVATLPRIASEAWLSIPGCRQKVQSSS